MKIKTALTTLMLVLFTTLSCDNAPEEDDILTGNEVNYELIPGEVQGITTTGTLSIKERKDGKAQIDITLNGVLNGAVHPVHLHFGSLEDNGLVATYLTEIRESNGVGKSSTIFADLDNGTTLSYADIVTFNGSVKIHFEETGALKDEVLGATNIGINSDGNEAFLSGVKSITVCNNDFEEIN